MTQPFQCPHCGNQDLSTIRQFDLVPEGFRLTGEVEEDGSPVVDCDSGEWALDGREFDGYWCDACDREFGRPGQVDKTPAVVLVVRHPDYENTYTVEGGEVRIVSIDLGSSFDSEPDDREQWEDWSSSVREDISDLPADSTVRKEVEALIAELEPED
jgi:hypothetical protein